MSEAVADNFLLPFAENYIYLKPLLESCTGAGQCRSTSHGALFADGP